MTTWTLEIDGMKCEGCSSRVEEGLGELDGVDDASADHDAGRARVHVAEGRGDAEAFEATVDELGFELLAVEEA